MAIITRSYTMTTGDTLLPSGINGDVYSTTSGKGIVSESNGGLNSANLSGDFEIQEHMITPGEVARADSIRNASTVEVVSEAYGTDDAANFIAIPGLSKRVYVPYDVSYMLWEWQFFFSVWRMYTGSYADQEAAPIIQTMAFLDGVALTHTRASCPETIFNFGPGQVGNKNEHLMADLRSGSHLETDVTRGWHELSVRLYMANQNMVETFKLVTAASATDAECQTAHRLSAGFRHVRHLSIL